MPDEKRTKKRGRRGGGSVFQKVPGGLWHIQCYAPDPDTGKVKCVKGYAKQTSKSDAQKLLMERLAGVAKGVVLAIKPATVRDLYDALFTFTKNNRTGKRAAETIGWHWRHLKPFFGHLSAPQVTTALIEKYRSQRLHEQAALATINRELATLRRMFNYGKQSTRPTVHNVPHFPMF